MKHLSFILSTIAFCFLFNIDSYAQTDCFPGNNGCTNSINVLGRVILPDYPECVFNVSYNLRVCQGETQLANLQLTGIEGDCLDWILEYLDAVFGGSQLESETFLKEFWSGLEEQLANQLWEQTVEEVISETGSLSLLDCDDGLTTFTAGFYRGSCVSFCFGVTEGQFSVSLQSCGTTCCARRISYCIDGETGSTVRTESTEQVNEGECFTKDLPTCPEGQTLQSPCFEFCRTN